MLRAVSLKPFGRRPMLTPTIGGRYETKVKQLNGARFNNPVADLVLTQAIGRGTTTAHSSLYAASPFSSEARISMCLPDGFPNLAEALDRRLPQEALVRRQDERRCAEALEPGGLGAIADIDADRLACFAR